MKYKGVEFLAGSVGGYIIYKVLDYVEPQVVQAFLTLNGVSLLMIADLMFLGVAVYGVFLILKERYGWFRKTELLPEAKYNPNLQSYWEHITKLRKTIEDDINIFNETQKSLGVKNESGIPNFYEAINNSENKKAILQHLVTYFSYPQQQASDIMLKFLHAHTATEYHIPPEWKISMISSFNHDFQHLFQIMGNGKPRFGICDGCEIDYAWEDKERCKMILHRFNEDKQGFIRKLFR